MINRRNLDGSLNSKDFAECLVQAHALLNDGDFDAARTLGVELNELAPTRPGPVLLLARIAQKQDGPTRKAEVLSGFLEQGVDDVKVKRELGQALLATGDFARARMLAEQVIAAGKVNFVDHMLIARSYFSEDNFEKAHAHAQEAQKLVPTRPGPVLLLGRIAQMLGGPARKAEVLSGFLEQGVDDVAVKRELGQALLATGAFSQARAWAGQIVTAGQAQFMDHMLIARSHFYEDNLERAQEHAEEAQKLAPTRPGPVLLLARIALIQGGPARKAEVLSDLLEQGVDDVKVKRELSQTLFATGDPARARALAEQIIAAGDAALEDRMIVARSYFNEENFERAAQHAQEVGKLAPTRPEPALLLARIAQMQGGPLRKAEVLSGFLEQGFDDFVVKQELAYCLISLGALEEVVAIARSIDLDKCSGSQLFQLSSIFEKCHYSEEADDCLRRIDPTEKLGNAALLSDYLQGKLDAETTLRIQTTRNIGNDPFGRAIKILCGADHRAGAVGNRQMIRDRLGELSGDCKGAEAYFATGTATVMREMPLVSIVAPIHRAGDQDNLLRQLLRQDYPNLEVVVVINGLGIDGASFEENLRKCENYKRVQIVVLPPLTPLSKVLNTGFSASTGAYIAKFDADDLYLDRYISRTINFMLSMSADICGKQQYFVHLNALECVGLQGARYEAVAHIDKMAGSGSTLVVSREVIEKIRFNESLPSGEDQDFYFRSWFHGFRIVFAPPFDHLVIRKAEKLEHTWRHGDLYFLADSNREGFLARCSKNAFDTLLNDLAHSADGAA